MNGLVLDTHAVVWALVDRARLSAAARSAIESANATGSLVFVATISLVELTYLIEKGRLPADVKARLLAAWDDPASNLKPAPLDRDIADQLEHVPRGEVPDLPDRVIAATATHLGLPLISRDSKLRASGVRTIW